MMLCCKTKGGLRIRAICMLADSAQRPSDSCEQICCATNSDIAVLCKTRTNERPMGEGRGSVRPNLLAPNCPQKAAYYLRIY